MHPQSPLLTISGTVLKEPDDLVILGAAFDSKMTFETLCFQSSFCFFIAADAFLLS